LHDISNARFQEAGLLFLLAHIKGGKRYEDSQRMLDWSRAAWKFWLHNRNSDGSCSEIYPNERSFCATSFTAARFMETVLLSGKTEIWEPEIHQCERTMSWLSENVNMDVANQVAASLLALGLFAELTGQQKFMLAAHKRLDQLRTLLRKGILEEYGGFDVGYQTITMGCLATLHNISRGFEVEDILRAAEAKVESYIDAKGLVSQGINSRNTQYIFPYAFHVLGSPVLGRIYSGLLDDVVLNPLWMDDRYCISLAIDYMKLML
jgi:hypothetical protein